MENEKLFCSSCGKELTPGTKFCTNCGTPVSGNAAPAPTQTPAAPLVTPEQKEALKQNANNLWAWVLDSFKTPTKETDSPAWYSWLTFGLTALFGALAVDKIVTNTLSAVGHGVGSLAGEFSGTVNQVVSNATAGIFSRLIFPLIVSAALILAAVIFGGWLSNFAVLGNKDFTFKKAVNFFGRPFVLILAGIIVTFLFALIGLNPIANFFGYISAIVLGIIGIYPFMTSSSDRKIDNFYSKLLAYAVYLGVLIVVFLIVAAIMGSVVAGMFGSFLGGL